MRRPSPRMFALFALCLLPQCMLEEAPPPREENFVTVRLNDSLKRFDSVEIVILADGDSAQVVGKVWTGSLPDPRSVPSYKLPEGENRDLSVRVRGFDSTGRLTLNLLISKEDGGQVVANLPLPIPPVIIPTDTGKPVVVPPDTTKPVVVPPDTTKPVIVPPKPSGLKVLEVSPGALSPAWDTSRTSYTVQLAYAESTITFNAVPLASEAVLRIGIDTLPNGKASQPFPMKVGDNSLSLTSSIDGRTTRYALLIKRAAPTNPDLIVDDLSPYRTWRHRAPVVIDLKTLGMDRSWKGSGIPLLLRLTKDNFNFIQAADDGRDIRFAAADGSRIPFEIGRWEPQNRRAEIWILSGTLNVSDDSVTYYMYWGSASAKSESDGNGVFVRADGHMAAYHLAEQGNGASLEYKDATGIFHGQGGDGNGRNVPQRVESIVGYGQDFNPAPSATNPPYRAAIGLSENIDPGPQYWTFQAWIKRVGDGEMTLFKKGAEWSAGAQRFELLIKGGTGGQFMVAREGAESYTGVYIPPQNYTHLGIVYTGTRFDVYVDGWLRESHPWTQGGAARGDCVLGGHYSDGTKAFQGIMDEVWISSRERTPMWMRLTFENQKPGSLLVTLRR